MNLLLLSQPSCNPCKSVKGFLQERSVNYQEFNVQEQPEKASQYNIMSVPVTILLNSDGNEVARSTGFNPAQLESLITKLNS